MKTLFFSLVLSRTNDWVDPAWSGIGQENEILIALSLEGTSGDDAYISSGNTTVDYKLGSLCIYLNT